MSVRTLVVATERRKRVARKRDGNGTKNARPTGLVLAEWGGSRYLAKVDSYGVAVIGAGRKPETEDDDEGETTKPA